MYVLRNVRSELILIIIITTLLILIAAFLLRSYTLRPLLSEIERNSLESTHAKYVRILGYHLGFDSRSPEE